MREEIANGLVDLGGGILVSCREKFGGICGSVVLRILRGGGVGFCCVFRVMEGDSEVVRGVEGRPEMVVVWVDLGEELGEV